MSRRTAVPFAIGLLLAVGVARPTLADPITDLSVDRIWSLHGCFTKYWAQPGFYSTSSTLCLSGTVDYGYSASMGQYGFTWNFHNDPITGDPVPPYSSLKVTMDCLGFLAPGDLPVHEETAGTCYPYGYGGLMGSGQLFSPYLLENSAVLDVVDSFQWVDATAPGPYNYDDGILHSDLVLVSPEPAPLTLVASGLAVLVGAQRIRRRRRM